MWDTTDIRVGRRRTMDLVIPDGEVSREHAIFEKSAGRLTVKDLGTGIGTRVNGNAITETELAVGDEVTIGNMTIRIGQTDKAIRPANNVRFASELKGGLTATPSQGEGGRTMLAFDAEDDLASSKPTDPYPETSKPRAVSLDGTLEESDDEDPLGLSIDANMLMGDSGVRNLDDELDETPPVKDLPGVPLPPISISPPPPPPAEAPPPPPPAPAGANTPPGAPDSRSRRTLVLEVDGPESEVDRLLAVLEGNPISVGNVQVRAKKLDFD